MACALRLLGLIGDISFKMDDAFAINSGIIFVHCKYIVKHLGYNIDYYIPFTFMFN